MIKNREMLFSDFPEMGKINSEIKAKNKTRVITGAVRISSGMYRTDEQTEKYKKDSLKRRLP